MIAGLSARTWSSVEPPTLHHARREVLGERVALRDQPLGQLAARAVAHVQRDAELVAVVVVEQPALVRVGVGVLLAVRPLAGALVERQAARHVEAVAVLDADHLGAEVGEQPGRDRADAHPAEVGDADSGQGPPASPRYSRRVAVLVGDWHGSASAPSARYSPPLRRRQPATVGPPVGNGQ